MILRSEEMELHSTSRFADPSELDDTALIASSREGDAAAFAELFRRHHAMAVRIAARTTRSLDAEDVAAEAFARVWAALVAGRGPTGAFRPYLAATVRNLALNGARVGAEVPTDPTLLPEGEPEDATAVAIAEADAVCRAFATLPDRWRSALWLTEVEGRPVSDLARSLGTSANAASALCLRAREGLKAAWLQAHVDRRARDAECRWVLEHLGAHARQRLPQRQRARVERHLDACEHCTTTSARLAVIGRTLKAATIFAGGGASLLAVKAAVAAGAGASVSAGAVLAFPSLGARLLARDPKVALASLGASVVVAAAALGIASLSARDEPEVAVQAVLTPPVATPTPRPSQPPPVTPTPTPEPKKKAPVVDRTPSPATRPGKASTPKATHSPSPKPPTTRRPSSRPSPTAIRLPGPPAHVPIPDDPGSRGDPGSSPG